MKCLLANCVPCYLSRNVRGVVLVTAISGEPLRRINHRVFIRTLPSGSEPSDCYSVSVRDCLALPLAAELEFQIGSPCRAVELNSSLRKCPAQIADSPAYLYLQPLQVAAFAFGALLSTLL